MRTEEAISFQTFALFHAILRHDESPDELSRATNACKWMAENINLLIRYLPDPDCEALGIGLNYYLIHSAAPSMDILQLDTLEEHVPATEEFLQDYKHYVTSGLPLMRTKEDMDHAFSRLVRAVQARSIHNIAVQGNRIALSNRKGIEISSPATGDPTVYKGPEGARRYISEALASPIHQGPFLLRNRSHEPGDWRDDPHEAIQELCESPAERIYTGIRSIDNAVAIRKGELVGVLGYTGSGKSRLGRTIAYNAMRDGRNVLHIVTEGGGRKVERVRYAIAHAHQIDPHRAQALGITYKAYADQILTADGLSFLKEAVEDLSREEGGITVVSPMERTWQEVRRILESESRKRNVDLLYVDYLTHLVPTTARDPRSAMATVIHEAQNLAAAYEHGRGLAFMTPVQGNRKGYEAAQSAGGTWTSDGLFEYSAFAMDCDLLLYVYSDEDLRWLNQIKVGSAKTRYACDMPCTTLNVDKCTQMISEADTSVMTQELQDALEDI